MWDNKRGAKDNIMLHYKAFIARARVHAPQFIGLPADTMLAFISFLYLT